ncbi:MAG: PEP-CTERM sorting domain-containing protein [Gammaproteobacteria bacterium]|nr:PEP-CTERM sorting domain-containing protein [Gammaproteobacteria bacterium]
MKSKSIKIILGTICLGMSFSAHSTLITNGFTFAVASSCSGGVQTATGTHFHSNTGGAFGNPAGLAEVGEFGGSACEEVRGLSEYNLTGLSAGPAFVTFDVFQPGGLFPGGNDFPFDGDINVVAYQANNAEDVSDYQQTAVGSVGSFSTVGMAVGDVFSFDITTILSNAIASSWSSLGMRLEVSTTGSDPNGGAWVFNNFRLTSTDDTSNVPEPAILVLISLSLAGIGYKRFTSV